jgi:hypothetical protein
MEEKKIQRRRYVAVLERDVFVGDFWTRGTSGEGVIGVSGLIVFFGVSDACTGTGASGHAFAAPTKHAEIGGDDFKTRALLAFLVLPLA